MLILTRAINESILIGNEEEINSDNPPIEIQILGYLNREVRIGIKADPNYVILRREVYERNLKEAAANGSS